MTERTLLEIGSDAVGAESPDDLIDVKLVGVKYTIHPPKSSFSLKLAQFVPAFEGLTEKAMRKDSKKALAALTSMNSLLEDWIHATFSKADAKKVLARLDDPADALDIDHIFELLKGVMEHTNGARPTT